MERRTGLAAGPEAAAGAERLRQQAFETAWRYLAHRERTEAELVARLERNDVEPALIEEVLGELREGGYVDDAGFAQRFAEDRRNLDGWGAERIERRLRELGVDREHIQAALAATRSTTSWRPPRRCSPAASRRRRRRRATASGRSGSSSARATSSSWRTTRCAATALSTLDS